MKPGRIAVILGACAAVASCSANAAAPSHSGTSGRQRNASSLADIPARRYLVCRSFAGICEGAKPSYAPAEVFMSADGSLYAKDVRWSRWGSATAVGHGTAEANNCQPNCASGTFSAHPVTIALSKPVRWHAAVVYSRVSFSIPSLHEHETMRTGLIPRPAPPGNVTGPSQPAQPGPVSSQATLAGNCAAGYEPAYTDDNGNVAYGPFIPGRPHGDVAIGGTRYTPTYAYQVTLTNNGSTTAEVDGFIIAFYNGTGGELGSDQQSFSQPTYITADQSLNWTQFSGADTMGNGLSGDGGTGNQDDNIPSDGFATCQLIQWTQP